MQLIDAAAWCSRSSLVIAIVLSISSNLLAQRSQVTASPAGQEIAPVLQPTAGPQPQAAAAPHADAVPSAATVSSPAMPTTMWMDSGISVIKTLGAVGLVICLILGGSNLFRRFAPQYISKSPNERLLKLVETLPIGDKRSILLVQAGNRRLLLAGTPGEVTLLTPLADDALRSSPGTEGPFDDEVPSPAASFKNLCEIEKKAPPVHPSPRHSIPPDIQGKMRELRKALEG